ncbi:MAG: LLM class F420-dependent oxidoreductase [Polyangiaceae bacterium]|nr:LLM class F420-dependent oxidoreductase [Myxococcales bacterium]MCB9586627.1 LLM class F420-dependent oxidoreductase [Polyangiaceae bacterium]MCB9606134.1 LLM class F420-dependent oxidoreductase [Polyangiaceae bacterium]
MRLGYVFGYSSSNVHINIELIQEAERLGYHSVWSAEAWGSDAVTPLAWIAAQTKTIKLGTGIMQMPGRSPANTAMTAMTMDALSGGRFLLGLGTSGPQVVEGWHGVPYHKPLTWTREYVEIVRKILERKEPLTYDGQIYQLPYKGAGSMGLGKPLKSILHGNPNIPIYLGSMAPKAQAQAGEIADGLLMTCLHPGRFEVVEENLQKGFDKAGNGKGLDNFDVAPAVACIVGDDLDACRMPLKMTLALYVGGMGAKNKNFYNEYVSRVGFEAEAKQIQDLYLAGKRNEAILAVTDEMVDTFNLVGPKERIKERFQIWKESKIGTMMVGTQQPEALRLLAELNS